MGVKRKGYWKEREDLFSRLKGTGLDDSKIHKIYESAGVAISSRKSQRGFAVTLPTVGDWKVAGKGARVALGTAIKGSKSIAKGSIPFAAGEYFSNLILGRENPSFPEFLRDYSALSFSGGIAHEIIGRVTKNGLARRAFPLFAALSVSEYVKSGKVDIGGMPLAIGNIMVASAATHWLGVGLSKSAIAMRMGSALKLVKLGSRVLAPVSGGSALLIACAASVVEFTILKALGEIENKFLHLSDAEK